MEEAAHEVGRMLSLLFVAAASATVTGLLGSLPGRSFRFRLLLIAAILAVGVIGATFVRLGAEQIFQSVVSGADGYFTSEEAILGLYLSSVCELVVLVLIVPFAYVMRCRLTRIGRK